MSAALDLLLSHKIVLGVIGGGAYYYAMTKFRPSILYPGAGKWKYDHILPTPTFDILSSLVAALAVIMIRNWYTGSPLSDFRAMDVEIVNGKMRNSTAPEQVLNFARQQQQAVVAAGTTNAASTYAGFDW